MVRRLKGCRTLSAQVPSTDSSLRGFFHCFLGYPQPHFYFSWNAVELKSTETGPTLLSALLATSRTPAATLTFPGVVRESSRRPKTRYNCDECDEFLCLMKFLFSGVAQKQGNIQDAKFSQINGLILQQSLKLFYDIVYQDFNLKLKICFHVYTRVF